jgi:hypothetical protein
MNTYTITIKSGGVDVQTRVTVDDSDGTPRVIEVAVRAADGSPLSGRLPSFDLDLLALALRSATTNGVMAEPTLDGVAAAAGDGFSGGFSDDDEDSRQPVSTAEPRSTARARKTLTQKTTAKRAGPAAKTPTRAVTTRARAYRKMPDDLSEMFARSGSVAAVAAHYGVPRHTAQGWIGRLRRAEEAD